MGKLSRNNRRPEVPVTEDTYPLHKEHRQARWDGEANLDRAVKAVGGMRLAEVITLHTPDTSQSPELEQLAQVYPIFSPAAPESLGDSNAA